MAKKKKGKFREEPYIPEQNDGSRVPIRAHIAAREAYDKYSDYPSEGLTPRKLAAIFKLADAGDVKAQMELFEEIEEKDAHVFSQLQTRKLAVTGLDWEIQPFSSDGKDKAIADWVAGQLNSLENLNDIMMDMLDAIGKGISVMEIEWGVDAGLHNVIEDIRQVHAKKLIWDPVTDEMKICTQEFPEGLSIPENKFVIHRYKAKSGHESRAGILRIVSWMYLFKNYSIKDWVAFAEVYGMPLRLGKYDASASKEDRDALMDAIISLGSDAAGIVPTSTMIEFIEAGKNSSTDVYNTLASYCDAQNSKAILGQTLSSDSGGGSYAQGKVHNEVRHDLTKADAAALESTIRQQVIAPLVYFNFGADADVPFFQFDCQDPEDLLQTAEVYVKLGTELGLPIATDHLYKKFNIPKPEEGQELAKPRKFRMDDAPISGEEEESAHKETDSRDAQEQIDLIAALAAKNSDEIFRQLFHPLAELTAQCSSLAELKGILEDEGKVLQVYKEMDSTQLQDMLHQGMYLAELIGRTEET